MYEIAKTVINSGKFELSAMLKKIDTLWIQGDLTDNQRTELVALAREKAIPENSYSVQKQLASIFVNLAEMEVQIKSNTDAITILQGGSVDEPAEEEYPEYVQPTGAHDAYNTGAKITWNGKLYICQMDGCVWNPDNYPIGWKEVTEEPTE